MCRSGREVLESDALLAAFLIAFVVFAACMQGKRRQSGILIRLTTRRHVLP